MDWYACVYRGSTDMKSDPGPFSGESSAMVWSQIRGGGYGVDAVISMR